MVTVIIFPKSIRTYYRNSWSPVAFNRTKKITISVEKFLSHSLNLRRCPTHPPPPPLTLPPKKSNCKKKELQKRKTKKKKKLNQKTEIGEKRGERTYSHYQNWRNDAMAKKDEDQSLWNASLSHSLQIKFLSKKK